MSTLIMVPQDETCIQRMLGREVIPAEIHTEYMIRLRMFHRTGVGGALGPIGCIDLLRSLEYAPPSSTSGAAQNKVDWHQIPIGTPVQIQNEEVWSPRDILFKFAGFVDNGTLAVESPKGRVDEYYKRNVRLLQDDLPDDLDKSSLKQTDKDEEEKSARQKAYEKQELANAALQRAQHQTQPPAPIATVQNAVDSSASTGDTDSTESQDDESQDDDQDGDDKGEALALALNATPPDWSTVAMGSAVLVRMKEDTYEATFQGLTNHRLKIVLNGDKEKKERYLRFDQVILAESL